MRAAILTLGLAAALITGPSFAQDPWATERAARMGGNEHRKAVQISHRLRSEGHTNQKESPAGAGSVSVYLAGACTLEAARRLDQLVLDRIGQHLGP